MGSNIQDFQVPGQDEEEELGISRLSSWILSTPQGISIRSPERDSSSSSSSALLILQDLEAGSDFERLLLGRERIQSLSLGLKETDTEEFLALLPLLQKIIDKYLPGLEDLHVESWDEQSVSLLYEAISCRSNDDDYSHHHHHHQQLQNLKRLQLPVWLQDGTPLLDQLCRLAPNLQEINNELNDPHLLLLAKLDKLHTVRNVLIDNPLLVMYELEDYYSREISMRDESSPSKPLQILDENLTIGIVALSIMCHSRRVTFPELKRLSLLSDSHLVISDDSYLLRRVNYSRKFPALEVVEFLEEAASEWEGVDGSPLPLREHLIPHRSWTVSELHLTSHLYPGSQAEEETTIILTWFRDLGDCFPNVTHCTVKEYYYNNNNCPTFPGDNSRRTFDVALEGIFSAWPRLEALRFDFKGTKYFTDGAYFDHSFLGVSRLESEELRRSLEGGEPLEELNVVPDRSCLLTCQSLKTLTFHVDVRHYPRPKECLQGIRGSFLSQLTGVLGIDRCPDLNVEFIWENCPREKSGLCQCSPLVELKSYLKYSHTFNGLHDDDDDYSEDLLSSEDGTHVSDF